MDVTLNPFAPEFQEDPYPTYRQLRESAPVYPAHFMGFRFVVLTRYEDVAAALRDPRLSAAAGLPPGVLNVVNGFGIEAGKPLAQNKRVAKVAFTGETTTGRLIMQYASENLIPVTLELGGKSPNIFFADVWARDDDFRQKALEGFTMFLLNQGEVCTCPSRALVDAAIYDDFVRAAVARTQTVSPGDPLDTDTRLGAQASNDQLEKILSYIDIGKKEGARLLTGGSPLNQACRGRPAFWATRSRWAITSSWSRWSMVCTICAISWSTDGGGL